MRDYAGSPSVRIGTKSRAGFTLIETMIAVTILTLSISGPLLGASRAVVIAQNSKDQLTASYLAQEALEYVRAMRDDAYLAAASGNDASTVAWADFTQGSSAWSITSCISTACTLDPARSMGYGATLSLFAYSGDAPLHLSNGIYTQQQIGTPTIFTRTIQASTVSTTEEKITSTVTWSSRGTTNTMTVIDHLTPWQ